MCIRDRIETVRYAPQRDRYRIAIIDEVHMLTTEAFNALLKTLEEPPQHSRFILASTELHKIPATIVSMSSRAFSIFRLDAPSISWTSSDSPRARISRKDAHSPQGSTVGPRSQFR